MYDYIISAYMDTEEPIKGSILLFNESNSRVGAFQLTGEVKHDLGVRLYKTQFDSLKVFFPKNRHDKLPLEKATAPNIRLGKY